MHLIYCKLKHDYKKSEKENGKVYNDINWQLTLKHKRLETILKANTTY